MNTLKTKLKDPEWCEHFRTYLTERFAAENLSFLLAVEQFRESAAANDADKSRSQAQEIVRQYLEPDAPLELNVSFQSKMSCKELIDELPVGEVPDPRTFDDTQVSVILLIMDYYKDFCSDQANLTALKDVCDTPQPRAPRQSPSEDVVRADDDDAEPAEEAGCLRVLTNLLRGR